MWEHEKNCIKDTLKIDIGENYDSRIHRVGLKIANNNGHVLQQIIVKFKGFSPKSSVYRARKRKINISFHLDLTKRRHLLLKEAYNKVMDDNRIDFVCGDINCWLCLRLRIANGNFLTPPKSLDRCYWIWSDFSLSIGGVFRTQSNISDEAFAMFARGSILDVWMGSGFASASISGFFFRFFELTSSLSEVYKISPSHQN